MNEKTTFKLKQKRNSDDWHFESVEELLMKDDI